MSQTVNIPNFDSLNILAQLNLTDDINAGVSALPVVNSANPYFATGALVVVGNLGAPGCELLTSTTPANSTTVSTTAPTVLPHDNNDWVSALFAASLNVYRAVDQYGTGQQPDDSNFSKINNSPVAINISSSDTAYTDQTGEPGMWYKFTYLNTNSGAETALSDSIAVRSGQVHYVSLQDIRRAAGFSDAPQVSDDTISRFRDAAEKEINGALTAVYNLPFPLPINPIIVQIAKNIAAGELMHEEYVNISPALAAEGEDKASVARNGGGSHTALADLVDRVVVLEDASYNELTEDEGHGFGGFPNGNSYPSNQHLPPAQRTPFRVDQEY